MKKFSVVLVSMLAGIAVALQVPSNGAAEAAATPMADADDCIYCLDSPVYCPDGWHDAWNDPDPNYSRRDGTHPYYRPCWEETCEEKHGPACPNPDGGGTFAMVDLDRLHGSIEAKDGQAVKDLLATYSQSTALNVERSALQAMDCTGTVIAHFPVDQKLLDHVSAE